MKMRSRGSQVSPELNMESLQKRTIRQRHTRRASHEDKGRDWGDASTSQRTAKVDSRQSPEHGSRRNQPCSHLISDFQLPDREIICLCSLGHQSAELWYSGPGRFVKTPRSHPPPADIQGPDLPHHQAGESEPCPAWGLTARKRVGMEHLLKGGG